LLAVALLALIGMVYLILAPDPLSDNGRTSGAEVGSEQEMVASERLNCDKVSWGVHRLAVIVPFRDRLDELLEFAPHIHRFLCDQHIRHQLFVISQVDPYRFNRGALVNVGFLLTENSSYDYIAVHDVDLLPVNHNLSYRYPADGPFHVSAPDLHPKYHYDKFLGGILLINNIHFRQVDGFSNTFWGWGREDDEFYRRIQEAHLTIFRPEGITTGNRTFRHVHDSMRRPRDSFRYGDQKAYLRRDHNTGVNSIRYTIASTRQVRIDDVVDVTIVNVHLNCKLEVTPWCLAPRQLIAAVRQERTHMAPDEFARLEHSLRLHNMLYYELMNGTNV
jgi:xylosylprotein 4-beta-galactosyltransferase